MGRNRQDRPEQPDEEEQLEPAGSEAELLDDESGACATAEEEYVRAEPAMGRIEALELELADWKDRCLRQAADMENLRHRTRREAEDARKFANERLVTDLLPVVDNFGRALEAAEQTNNADAFKSGVEQIHRLLSDVLGRAGLTRIEALGAQFDPNLHEAILQVPTGEDQEPGIVVEELRPGYRLNERVVRPSLVKVTS